MLEVAQDNIAREEGDDKGEDEEERPLINTQVSAQTWTIFICNHCYLLESE